VGKPYGKFERKIARSPRQKKSDSETFKIKLRGRDDAPLSMPELQQALLEVIGALRRHESMRAKHVTIYAKFVDETGKPVLPDPSGEWEIVPYKSAADELGR
jgi:hypothetical protein